MTTHRGFEPEDLDRLQSASSWLHGLADNDCNCEGDAAERRLNPCLVCQARHARDLIEQCLAPRHEVLWPERLKNHAERLFVERWRQMQERHTGISGGYGMLELILQPEAEANKAHGGFGRSYGYVPIVSQRDATVAATVIQWLGTNCGGAFIQDVENRIKQERAIRNEFSCDYPLSSSNDAQEEILKGGPLKKAAESVAADYVCTDKHKDAARCLANAIVNVAVQWHKRELAKLLQTTKPESEAV